MERKQYSMAEVAQNNGRDGKRCWIVLWGSVYDVTGYLDKHPGGGELIDEFAGMDATAGFDDFGHSSDAKKLLKKFEIGLVAKLTKAETARNKKNKQTSDDLSDAEEIRIRRENTKQRRKFLSVILGPCASA